MRVPVQALIIVSMFLGADPAGSEKLNFRPGEWELTSELELKGEPRARQEWTETKCVALDELRSGKLFMGKLDISGCDPGEPELEGRRMLWRFECLDDAMGRRIEAEVEVRLYGDRLEGITKSDVTTAQGALYITTKFDGHRKGACE